MYCTVMKCTSTVCTVLYSTALALYVLYCTALALYVLCCTVLYHIMLSYIISKYRKKLAEMILFIRDMFNSSPVFIIKNVFLNQLTEHSFAFTGIMDGF